MCCQRCTHSGGAKIAQRSLGTLLFRKQTLSLINATHAPGDERGQFRRGCWQIEVLEVQAGGCLIVKESHRVKE